jgi:hypothetical protein
LQALLRPRERASHGVRYEACEQTKGDLYQALLPVLNAKRIDLLDIPRLCSLERKTHRDRKTKARPGDPRRQH